jgi:hypothetical protein
MRALVDPTYRPALHWLAQLTIYLDQLGELQAPTAGAQRISRSNSSRSN